MRTGAFTYLEEADMNGVQLYEKLIDSRPILALGQKEALIEILQDALDVAKEAGREEEETRWLESGAVC